MEISFETTRLVRMEKSALEGGYCWMSRGYDWSYRGERDWEGGGVWVEDGGVEGSEGIESAPFLTWDFKRLYSERNVFYFISGGGGGVCTDSSSQLFCQYCLRLHRDQATPVDLNSLLVFEKHIPLSSQG